MSKAMLAMLVALSVGPSAWASDAKTTLRIQGMTCGGCVAAVNLQLKRTEGVTAYAVSYEKAEAQVTYDPARTTPAKIAESVSTTGYAATVTGDGAPSGVAASGPSCREDWCASARAGGPSKEATAAGLVSLAGGDAPLVAAFNAAKARSRFVAILSPTCGACVHGADAIKAAVLPLGPSVEVFIVWAPMLGSDAAPAASASAPGLAAPNVRQYWDPQRRVGTALRAAVFPDAAERMKGSLPKGHFMTDQVCARDATQPEWDIYLLYDPGIEWKGTVPAPSRWVRQVALYGKQAEDGGPKSLMWKNDYSAAPVEGSLTAELRAMLAARRAAAIR